MRSRRVRHVRPRRRLRRRRRRLGELRARALDRERVPGARAHRCRVLGRHAPPRARRGARGVRHLRAPRRHARVDRAELVLEPHLALLRARRGASRARRAPALAFRVGFRGARRGLRLAAGRGQRAHAFVRGGDLLVGRGHVQGLLLEARSHARRDLARPALRPARLLHPAFELVDARAQRGLVRAHGRRARRDGCRGAARECGASAAGANACAAGGAGGAAAAGGSARGQAAAARPGVISSISSCAARLSATRKLSRRLAFAAPVALSCWRARASSASCSSARARSAIASRCIAVIVLRAPARRSRTSASTVFSPRDSPDSPNPRRHARARGLDGRPDLAMPRGRLRAQLRAGAAAALHARRAARGPRGLGSEAAALRAVARRPDALREASRRGARSENRRAGVPLRPRRRRERRARRRRR